MKTVVSCQWSVKAEFLRLGRALFGASSLNMTDGKSRSLASLVMTNRKNARDDKS